MLDRIRRAEAWISAPEYAKFQNQLLVELDARPGIPKNLDTVLLQFRRSFSAAIAESFDVISEETREMGRAMNACMTSSRKTEDARPE